MVKKKIMVVTPRFPYPVIGGDRLRIFEVCRELSRHYELHLYSLCANAEEMNISVPQDGVFAKVHRFLQVKSRSYISTLCAIPTQRPLQVAYYENAALKTAVESDAKHFDACLGHLIRVADYLTPLKIPKILEMTDAISMNYERVKHDVNWLSLKSIIYAFEFNRLNNYEKKQKDKFNLLNFISEVDAKYLFGCIPKNVVVSNNGVDLSQYKFSRAGRVKKTIVFVGNMNSLQNADACGFFAKEVLPKLRALDPEIKFRVVGRMDQDFIERYHAMPGVELMPNVLSVEQAVADAMIGVASIRYGAGVQNKVLEYMALGLPSIISDVAAEGLSVRDQYDCLVARTVDDYVRAVMAILKSPELADNIARQGLSYVTKHHAWNEVLAPLIQRVRQLV